MDFTIFQYIDYRALLLMGGFLGLLVLFLFGLKKLPMKARGYPHKKIDLREAAGGRTR